VIIWWFYPPSRKKKEERKKKKTHEAERTASEERAHGEHTNSASCAPWRPKGAVIFLKERAKTW